MLLNVIYYKVAVNTWKRSLQSTDDWSYGKAGRRKYRSAPLRRKQWNESHNKGEFVETFCAERYV